MRIPRIYTEQALASNTELELEEAPSHHLIKVLRMAVGRSLILFNGQGGHYDAEIIASTKKYATVKITQWHQQDNESPLNTTLAIGLSRGERFDLVLQKATELGVTSIQPMFTERTEVKLSGDRLNKKFLSWQKIIIAACEQSGRNILPTLKSPIHIQDYFTQERDQQQLKLVLHHRNSSRFSELEKTDDICLLIGPEGGLSQDEIDLAHKHDFKNLSLGPRVLRTETAPLAALAIMQQCWGDF
ncbi:16S rRNA (uracil(1498)-N(3))-methyltransferase [Agaribacterium sp. ZY112]|uniref:16S rRNA (uracil(1498)-N(3))-methyltransferase n=1 Tax=Agaribacterium sp. ZY112 TaxID=3233574 RepID=UPI00352588CE